MSEKPIMDHLNEAEKYADEITDLLARTVDFQKEKPGGRMQSFYRAMRVVHDNLSRLTPEERDRSPAASQGVRVPGVKRPASI